MKKTKLAHDICCMKQEMLNINEKKIETGNELVVFKKRSQKNRKNRLQMISGSSQPVKNP